MRVGDGIWVAAVKGDPDAVDAWAQGRQALPSTRSAVPAGGCARGKAGVIAGFAGLRIWPVLLG
jgi:hypothetical protein